MKKQQEPEEDMSSINSWCFVIILIKENVGRAKESPLIQTLLTTGLYLFFCGHHHQHPTLNSLTQKSSELLHSKWCPGSWALSTSILSAPWIPFPLVECSENSKSMVGPEHFMTQKPSEPSAFSYHGNLERFQDYSKIHVVCGKLETSIRVHEIGTSVLLSLRWILCYPPTSDLYSYRIMRPQT